MNNSVEVVVVTHAADVAVIGGGIVGLATARHVLDRHRGAQVVVLEKERAVGTHQTGRNSGVVHAGVYYPPGSLKARLCVEGRVLMQRFAETRAIPYHACGKVVVAVEDAELPRLEALHERAVANGVPGARLLSAREVGALEPAVRAVAGLHSPQTAITDFAAVAHAVADDVRAGGGQVMTGAKVTGIEQDGDGVTLRTSTGALVRARRVVACAGLWSDRVAALAGDAPAPRIVPFRGDYYRLRPQRRALVRGLVYPVPDPRYPFLGVHLTRTVHGEVLVGPNAFLAFAREGYSLATVRPRELWDAVSFPGFRRLARRHWRTGAGERTRAVSRHAFAAAARRYVPALRAGDLERAPAGVRAQAVDDDGSLVDDFRITAVGRVVSVRNAPSPAATSSFSIARELVARIDGL